MRVRTHSHAPRLSAARRAHQSSSYWGPEVNDQHRPGGAYERIGRPEDVDNPHLMRYRFAARWVEGAEVLDAACGIGFGAPVLLAGGARSVHGVDLDAAAIETARATYGSESATFEAGACLEIVGRWDAVVSIETIEHLADGEAWAEHVARNLLREGGVAVISTRVRHGGSIHDTPENPYHVREWSVAEFEALLTGLFERVEMHYQGFSPPPTRAWRPLRPLLRTFMYRRMMAERDLPVLSPEEWFTHFEFGPRYMVAVCREPRQ